MKHNKTWLNCCKNGKVWLECDVCGGKTPKHLNHNNLWNKAVKGGWRFFNEIYCPGCVKKMEKNKEKQYV